jgi:hypothetical protein
MRSNCCAAKAPCQNILESGHIAKEADILVGPQNTSVRYLSRRAPFEGFAAKNDISFIDIVEAGYAVEKSGLAGAIRTDDAPYSSFWNRNGKIIDSHQPAEALGDMLCVKKYFSHSHYPTNG